MAIVWFVAQTDTTEALLLAMSYAMFWSIILAMYAVCYGRGWWKWSQISTYVTIAAGPVLGLWSLVTWLSLSVLIRMFDPAEADPYEQEW